MLLINLTCVVQIYIRSGGGGGSTSKSKSKGGAAAEANDDHRHFTAEYAKTNKSKCRGCEENIPKVRIPAQLNGRSQWPALKIHVA